MNIALTQRTETPVGREAIISTLVAAFEGDAAVRSMYPGADEYHEHFPGFLMAFGGRAFDAGMVDSEAGLGAALWFPPGLYPDGDAIMAHLEASLPPERFEVLSIGMEVQSSLHPHEPHWYLPWVGVVPQAQSSGVGAALLRRGLQRADADHMPAYLEATNRRNAQLYQRFGFEVAGIVSVPGYPEIIPMWRPGR